MPSYGRKREGREEGERRRLEPFERRKQIERRERKEDGGEEESRRTEKSAVMVYCLFRYSFNSFIISIFHLIGDSGCESWTTKLANR